MREQLDILERVSRGSNGFRFPDIHDSSLQNLAQFSPRELKTIELAPEEFPSNSSMRSAPPGTPDFAPSSSQGPRFSPRRDRLDASHRGSKRQVPTIQQLQPVQPSREMVEDDVKASPPSFRQPVLVGTPSPIADSFRGVDQPGARNKSSSEGYVLLNKIKLSVFTR